jgi:hypothetical protein
MRGEDEVIEGIQQMMIKIGAKLNYRDQSQSVSVRARKNRDEAVVLSFNRKALNERIRNEHGKIRFI